MLSLITFRPEFAPPWTGQAHVTALTLNRLGRREGAAMVARLTGDKALPAEVLDADRGQDRRRAAVRRGADQDGAGDRACSGTRATTTSCRAAAAARDPDRRCTTR